MKLNQAAGVKIPMTCSKAPDLSLLPDCPAI